MCWLLGGIGLLLLLMIAGHRASKVAWAHPIVNWVDGLVRLLCKYIHRLPATYIPLPEDGSAIVVANHVSGLDPLLLIAASRRPLRFLIAREEYERPVLHWLFKAAGCIPVDRKGRPELALRQALRALQNGDVVALFPHGKIHLDSYPPRKIKGGVSRLAAWSSAPIYPVRIDGVGAEGHVAIAPFYPSKVRLTINEVVSCHPQQLAECLAKITLAIETPEPV